MKDYVCTMKSWLGSYYEGQQAEPEDATVLASEKKITIGLRREGGQVILHWDTREIEAVFYPSLQATTISTVRERNNKLIIGGKAPADFINQVKTEQSKPWHKKDRTRVWARNGSLLLGIVAVLVAAYFLLVPWLSEKMAGTVSIGTEEQIGNAVYHALQLSVGEDAEATALLNEFFREMNVTTGYPVRITVVKSDVVNAFALPGGHIVVYSALLRELKTYPELAALLSHEFTHVDHRHATKSIFRQLGSRIFLSLLFGKLGNVTAVVTDQADRLKSLTYSRKLEKEADMNGLKLLQERKIDPEGFVLLLQRLKAATPGSALPEFLGSHPDIDKRITYIREASAGAEKKENSRLKSIFDKLK